MAESVYESLFTPKDAVFHVGLTTGIRKGIVEKIQVIDEGIEANDHQIVYYVLFAGATRTIPVTEGLYADLGVATGGALEAYQELLEIV